MADRLAVARKAGGAVGQVAQALLLADRHAEVGPRIETVDALPALRREQRHHVVADRDIGHSLSDSLDDARALMPEHRRRIAGRIHAGSRVEIRVADAARHQAHQHLARTGIRKIELLNHQGLAELLQHRRTHLHPSKTSMSRS